MGLKERLKSNEKLRYLGVCFRKRNDEAFREKLLALHDKPDTLIFRHLGSENPDENIYLIYLDNPNRGFFSQFNLVLDGLQFADYYHLTPVVEWGASTLYHEAGGIDGVLNSYEYYFRQPGSVTVESARHSENVVFFETLHRKLSIPNFKLTLGASLEDEAQLERYLERRAEIIRRYIAFNDGVKRYLGDMADPLFQGSRVVGVHVRGTDMKVGFKGHAKLVLPEEYLEATKEAFGSGRFDKVFLATDETAVIKLFKEAFGDSLIYFTDALRSEDGEALHFSNSDRPCHKYLLGLEVLRDMYALSISDGLIAGVSNVSLAARMMKKSYGREYECINILSHGFNETNLSMMSKKGKRG